MKTKLFYILYFTLTLSSYALCNKVIAETTQLKSSLEDQNTQNTTPETSPYLRPLLDTPPVKPTAVTPLPKMPEYILAGGDVISITVFNEGGQGGNFPIFTDGTISIPLIGNFKIAGMTIKEVNTLFQKEYARYLKRPIVTVTIVSQRPLQLAIAGEINAPGTYTLANDPKNLPKITTLLKEAGGLTVSADIGQVTLKRQERGGEKVYVLDFWNLLKEGDLSQNITLQDGDIILINKKENTNFSENRLLNDATFGVQYKKAPNVTMVGEVNRPGAYLVPIESTPRITVAIKQAGGINELADIRNIQVRRTTRDGEEKTINVDLWDMLQTGNIEQDIILQQDDRIIIPTAKEIDPTEAQQLASANFSPDEILVNIIGPVRGGGGKKLPPNTSLNQALFSAGGFDERRANQEVVELVRLNQNGTVTKRSIRIDLTANVNEANNPLLKDKDVILVSRNGLTAFTDTIDTITSPLGRTFSFLNFYNSFGNLFDSFGN